MKTTPIKFAIADDHHLFRQGVITVLAEDKRFQCIGDVSNGEELLDLLEEKKADVIFLDVQMPVKDGVQTAMEIYRKYPSIKVLMLSMFEEEHFIIHLMESGACGYLGKSALPNEIKAAIVAVHEQGYYLNNLTAKTLFSKVAKKQYLELNFNKAHLNKKELELIKLTCDGLTASEIAEKMFMSRRTVEGMRSQIQDKIGVRNVAALVVYALRNGIYV